MNPTSATPPAPSPEQTIAQMAMGGWISASLSLIARLNIADALKSGPKTAAEVADLRHVDASALGRVMRACASIGLFTESSDGKYGLTPLSQVLTSDSPTNMKPLVREMGGWWLKSFTALEGGVRTGQNQARQVCGMDSWWEYLNQNPQDLEDFGEAMQSNSLNSMRGVLEHCDFSKTKKVVDIGGGFGHLVIALLDKYAHLRGAVLDLPEVIPVAKRRLPIADPYVAERFEYFGGDMFDSVPPADCYILKHIIHDWNDAFSAKLLNNCHASLEEGGRLICVDSVIPPMGDTSATPAKFLSILMQLTIDGKERTREEWEALYRAAGFKLEKITPLQDNFGTSIVEGVKV